MCENKNTILIYSWVKCNEQVCTPLLSNGFVIKIKHAYTFEYNLQHAPSFNAPWGPRPKNCR